jgi:hypothetical protein
MAETRCFLETLGGGRSLVVPTVGLTFGGNFEKRKRTERAPQRRTKPRRRLRNESQRRCIKVGRCRNENKRIKWRTANN